MRPFKPLARFYYRANESSNEEEETMTNYTWIPEYWGTDTTEEESEAACQRAEDYLTEHEGDEISITVRPALQGEIPGLYRERQILGPGDAPEGIVELTDKAYAHAVDTWFFDAR